MTERLANAALPATVPSSSSGPDRASTATPKQPLIAAVLRLAVVFLVLNLPYWWLGRTNFLSRPWFNVDLLLPAILAPISLLSAAVALVVLWVFDLAVAQSLAWNFNSPYEFIRSIEFVPMLHVRSYLSTESVLQALSFIACAALALHGARRMARGWAAAAVVVFALAAIDILNGSSFVRPTAQRPLPGNVAGSAVKAVATSMLSLHSEPLQPLPARASLTDQFDVMSYARLHPDRGILLVVVESLGLHQDAAMRRLLHDRLVNARLANRFAVEEFSIPFNGSTVAAELRELCGVQGDYRRFLESSRPCLPARLVNEGWTTIGLHGFSHRMFMRGEWWKQTGLQQTLFAEDWTTAGQPRCGGAFVGICDADLLRKAVHEAEQPKRFVYALTLNSHLPLEAPKPDADTARRCAEAHVGPDVCALFSVNGEALRALGVALADVRRPPLVLVVGDHAPPFAALTARKQFSPSSVPGLVLLPMQ